MSELITTSDRGSAARPMPLKGIRIVDFTAVLSGPYCTYQLALLGADVIKIERPGGGDNSRGRADMPDVPGLSTPFMAQNANKRSIQIDMSKPAGLALAHKLIAGCDVLMENYTPGVADKLGIGYEAMRALNPNMIYASLSGYGQDGAYSRRPAYDHIIQGACGITMLTGTEETVPNRMGPPLFDYVAGIYGAFAVLAAITERNRTGQGQRIDIAMLDAALLSMASFASRYLNGGKKPKPSGNAAASGSPASGIFPTADGLLTMTANTQVQFERLASVLGEPNILADERFRTKDSRAQHEEAFRTQLLQRLATRSAAEWETLMAKVRLPAVRVRTLDEILDDPHVATRGVEQKMTDPVSGKVLSVPTVGFKWNGQTLGPNRMPPRLGADADSVLAELGLDEAAISALKREGVVLRPPVK